MTIKTSLLKTNPMISFWLSSAFTLVALLLGWLLMGWVTNRTISVSQSGVSAAVPAGWLVEYGLQEEQMIFWTADQLDLNHRYIVTLLPAVPGGQITDTVVSHNLSQGQVLSSFQVISQKDVRIKGQDGFQVTYVYVKPSVSGGMPVIIQGVDTYRLTGTKILLVTMEDEASAFSLSVNKVNAFLESVLYTAGG